MDLKEAFLLARNVGKGRWFVIFICSLVMSLAGGTYIFCMHSGPIKRVLGYDQEIVTSLEFFKDLGGNVGIVSDLINEIALPWVVLGIGAMIMCISGYLLIWLSVTQRIARPKTWQTYLCIFLRANSQPFTNTGDLVTCVKKFPQSRGSVLGILIGFVWLSGAIFTQIYHAIYGQEIGGVNLLLGIVPAALALAVMVIVRSTKVVADKKELKRFCNFLYTTLALAGFLMIMIVVENIMVVMNAEMENMKLQRITSQTHELGFQIDVRNKNKEQNPSGDLEEEKSSEGLIDSIFQARNESQKPVQIHVKIKDEEKSKTEISSGNFMSEAPMDKKEGKNNKQPISLRSLVIKMFKSPTRGEEYSIPLAIVRADLCQIGKCLGYIHVSISTSVSLLSSWNFPGPLVAGFLSDFLLERYKFCRPLMFTIIFLIALVGHKFIPFGLPGSLYVVSVVIDLSLRSCLVNEFHFINGKRREGERKVLNQLPCCGYTDLKTASLPDRNVAMGRWSVVFLCILLMSTAEGATMRGIYSQTQSAQTLQNTDINQYAHAVSLGHGASQTTVHSPGGTFDVEKYEAGGDGKHFEQVAVSMTERVVMDRKLLEGGKSKPPKPSINKGPPGKHDDYSENSPGV